MEFRLETDSHETGEVMVAYRAKMAEDNNSAKDDNSANLLDKLTLDQLRRLCRNVGVPYVNKCSKFQCRKALWILANHQEQREKDGARVTTSSERTSSNIVRLCNVIFGHNFFEDFLKLNDIKTRSDHETGGLPSDFWADVAEALNGACEDDDSAETIVLSEEDPHYEELLDLDLTDYDILTASVIRKKFNMLMKVRKVMQKNMTISGEHDNKPYNFVEVAMKKAGSSGLTKIGCYYFFALCQANPEVDVRFADTMEENLMGNTNSQLDSLETLTESSGGSGGTATGDTGGSNKKRAYAAIVDMSTVGATIANEMKETNRISQESHLAMKEKNGIAKQSQLIQLAQHLGKEDILEGLLANLASES